MSAKPLADLVGKAVSPACRKRGFASVDIIAAWPDIVGERYGERVQPERLIWPRQSHEHADDEAQAARPATLVVHTDGPTALLLSHETAPVIERINTFFGWKAVGRIKIVQRPVRARPPKTRRCLRELTRDEQHWLDDRLAGVENDRLRTALQRLGSQVIAKQKPTKAGSR